jgi:hypothetical protein
MGNLLVTMQWMLWKCGGYEIDRTGSQLCSVTCFGVGSCITRAPVSWLLCLLVNPIPTDPYKVSVRGKSSESVTENASRRCEGARQWRHRCVCVHTFISVMNVWVQFQLSFQQGKFKGTWYVCPVAGNTVHGPLHLWASLKLTRDIFNQKILFILRFYDN